MSVLTLYRYTMNFGFLHPQFLHPQFDPKDGYKKLLRELFFNRGPDLESWDRPGSENIFELPHSAIIKTEGAKIEGAKKPLSSERGGQSKPYNFGSTQSKVLILELRRPPNPCTK